MFSAHCRPGLCHYPESHQYLQRKSIRPLCLAERPTLTVTRITFPIVPVSSDFCCCSSSSYCPLLERLPWSRLPLPLMWQGVPADSPLPVTDIYVIFITKQEAEPFSKFYFTQGWTLCHDGRKFVSSLQFSSKETYICKAQPDWKSTDNLTLLSIV
jgi:hypothetical protein